MLHADSIARFANAAASAAAPLCGWRGVAMAGSVSLAMLQIQVACAKVRAHGSQ